MHGALNTFDSVSPGLGWIGIALLPGLFALFLLFAPWIGKKWDWIARTLPTLILIGIGVMAALKGGTPAPAWGLQEVQESTKSEPQANGKPIDDALASRGFGIAKANCGCHGPELKGAAKAPNLHEVYRRHSDAEWFTGFLIDPKSKKPSTTMPSMRHLTDVQLVAIAEWLRKPK
jgi:mono/diheme cytochrome c family protein